MVWDSNHTPWLHFKTLKMRASQKDTHGRAHSSACNRGHGREIRTVGAV